MQEILELAQTLATELRRQNTHANRSNPAFVAGIVKAVAQVNDCAEPIVAGHPYRAKRSRSQEHHVEEHEEPNRDDDLDGSPDDLDL